MHLELEKSMISSIVVDPRNEHYLYYDDKINVYQNKLDVSMFHPWSKYDQFELKKQKFVKYHNTATFRTTCQINFQCHSEHSLSNSFGILLYIHWDKMTADIDIWYAIKKNIVILIIR